MFHIQVYSYKDIEVIINVQNKLNYIYTLYILLYLYRAVYTNTI